MMQNVDKKLKELLSSIKAANQPKWILEENLNPTIRETSTWNINLEALYDNTIETLSNLHNNTMNTN